LVIRRINKMTKCRSAYIPAVSLKTYSIFRARASAEKFPGRGNGKKDQKIAKNLPRGNGKKDRKIAKKSSRGQRKKD